MRPRELFLDDTVRRAFDSAGRLRADHHGFRADHPLGAFRMIDIDCGSSSCSVERGDDGRNPSRGLP